MVIRKSVEMGDTKGRQNACEIRERERESESESVRVCFDLSDADGDLHFIIIDPNVCFDNLK